MKKNTVIFNLLAIAGALIFSQASITTVNAQAEIDTNFNPNFIISDSDLMDYSSMTLPDIQNFLQSKNSYLANYITPNNNGVMKTAAEIIYDATNRNFNCEGITLSDAPTEDEKRIKCRTITTVSPKFILVLLQKEASLVEDTSPSESRLDWATGYGCPDNWTCNPYYKGFGKQVNSAALQFLAYMNEQHRYKYQAGNTYTFTNPYGTISKEPMPVTPQNKATAALYNYTPHVFNGNYNTYKLFLRYFPTSSSSASLFYPDGSLLKLADGPGVWLIENGKKRPFLNYASLISRFSPRQILIASKEAVNAYPTGESIKFPDYSLVQTPDKKIYLLAGTEKHPFDSLTTFKAIGFNAEEIEPASETELAGYFTGKAITATSTYVTGALLQDSKTGGVYYVENGNKAPITDKIFLSTKFKGKSIIKATTEQLAAYTTVSPVVFNDGALLKSDSFPVVYLISNGAKRAFTDEVAFKNLGYNFENVITVSSQVLYQYPLGEAIQ